MSKPTRDQIIEGRDEALEHLGLVPFLWDRRPPARQRSVILDASRRDPVSRAAAFTVIEGEAHLSGRFGARLEWAMTGLRLSLIPLYRQTDYTLQA